MQLHSAIFVLFVKIVVFVLFLSFMLGSLEPRLHNAITLSIFFLDFLSKLLVSLFSTFFLGPLETLRPLNSTIFCIFCRNLYFC